MFIMIIPSEPGSYAIFLKLPVQQELTIGRLGRREFLAGEYMYFGSACGSGGLKARLGRHLRKGKKHHWHIDAISAAAEFQGFCYFIEQKTRQRAAPVECLWCQAMMELPEIQVPLPGFGASDCKMGCRAHLLCVTKSQPFNYRNYSDILANTLQVPLTAIICQLGD